MRAAISLTVGTVAFIYLRAVRTDIPVFTLLWWSWLILTVLVSAGAGWAWCLVWIKYRRKKK